MKHFLIVFLGGGIGSSLRYIISKWLNNMESTIPYGTFLVNIIGSFLIGIILGLALKNSTFSESQSLLLATGFCGGFTTFSTFTYENYTLLKSGDLMSFILYTFGSLTLGILAVYVGLGAVKNL